MAKVITQISKYTARTFSYTPTANLLTHLGLKLTLGTSRSFSATRCLKTNRLYTESHEWVTVDGKIGTIGISNYAQEALGDVVYAQLPEVDAILEKGVECGALESVKAASELLSPVCGKVVEKNDTVEETPKLVNTSCYKEGWLFKVELTNPDDIKDLMDEKAYDTYLKTDPH